MFTRNKNDKLVFQSLNFSMFVLDIIENAKPKNMHELQWMIERIMEELQQCAQDYCDEDDTITEEWEPIY